MPWGGAACDSTMPSARLRSEVRLPIPTSALSVPGPERLSSAERCETYRLSPGTLIAIAFDNQPDIKSSFHRFKSEEGSYDFFVTSRDSLTPRLRAINTFGETRDVEVTTLARGPEFRQNTVERNRDHTVELSVEKQFFDTTELNVGVGFRTTAVDEALGTQPFVSANLRYPLWVSRQKLVRTSEDIFRRNELNDAQLDYIQEVRRRLQSSLFRFYDVINRKRQVQNGTRWLEDLNRILDLIDSLAGRDVTEDRRRVEAEVTRVSAIVREAEGWFDIQVERLKASCGLAFHAKIELVDEPFNPFEDASHEELLRLGIETDPEIATLRNEERNAQVELDLARRGRWDVQLLLNGFSSLEGSGEDEGVSDWSVSAGIDVSAVDPRVTDSLARQAEGRIARFRQAIVARENNIYVSTFESWLRIQTLNTSREELARNLPRFEQDFRHGLREYQAANLNIDDLLTRRATLFDQEQEIARLIQFAGANVAELCSATGTFFDLLEARGGEPAGP